MKSIVLVIFVAFVILATARVYQQKKAKRTSWYARQSINPGDAHAVCKAAGQDCKTAQSFNPPSQTNCSQFKGKNCTLEVATNLTCYQECQQNCNTLLSMANGPQWDQCIDCAQCQPYDPVQFQGDVLCYPNPPVCPIPPDPCQDQTNINPNSAIPTGDRRRRSNLILLEWRQDTTYCPPPPPPPPGGCPQPYVPPPQGPTTLPFVVNASENGNGSVGTQTTAVNYDGSVTTITTVPNSDGSSTTTIQTVDQNGNVLQQEGMVSPPGSPPPVAMPNEYWPPVDNPSPAGPANSGPSSGDNSDPTSGSNFGPSSGPTASMGSSRRRNGPSGRKIKENRNSRRKSYNP